MKPLLVFSANEYWNSSDGIALELGVPFQKIVDNSPIHVEGYDKILVQNPYGMRERVCRISDCKKDHLW